MTSPTPSVLTSLECQESNAHWQLQHLSPYERWRHEEWAKTRLHTAQTLERLYPSPKIVSRFCSCGSGAIVEQHRRFKDRFRLKCIKCKHRLCFPCQRERGFLIQQSLERLGETAGRRLTLLTLTLKHTSRDLRSTLTRLLVAFRELRRCLLWKRNVKGGAWSLEIKVGKDGLWHPHIHALLDQNWMDQGPLCAAWLTVTGDSTGVHIKRMHFFNGARYISKYITKPVDPTVLADQDKFEEFILATKGLRKCSTLGTWRGTKLAEHPPEEVICSPDASDAPENWQTYLPLDSLLEQIRDGNPAAVEIFRSLKIRLRKGCPP
jgi:replication protein